MLPALFFLCHVSADSRRTSPHAPAGSANYIDTTATSVTVSGNSAGYPNTFVSPCNVGQSSDGPEVWFAYTAPSDGVVVVSATSAFSAAVTVLADSGVEGGGYTVQGCSAGSKSTA